LRQACAALARSGGVTRTARAWAKLSGKFARHKIRSPSRCVHGRPRFRPQPLRKRHPFFAAACGCHGQNSTCASGLISVHHAARFLLTHLNGRKLFPSAVGLRPEAKLLKLSSGVRMKRSSSSSRTATLQASAINETRPGRVRDSSRGAHGSPGHRAVTPRGVDRQAFRRIIGGCSSTVLSCSPANCAAKLTHRRKN